jgi:hypothetical protein
MNVLFKKLNFKTQEVIHILNSPTSFQAEITDMKTYCDVKTALNEYDKIEFVLFFATKQDEIDQNILLFDKQSEGDVVIWFAYPKGSSKKYKCEFNRDTGWEILGKLGFEPVRAVAIDEDWSALRFRRVSFIKTMTRSFALSEEGKNKGGLK